MRSIEFLAENEVVPYEYEKLSIATAVAVLNEHCKQSVILVNNPIWRGMRNHGQEILTINPSTGTRKSTNTTNHYTLIIDNSPYFVGWPKRSRSLICSTNIHYAGSYGSYGDSGLYAIFPYDGVKIAVCPFSDIWETKISIPELNVGFADNYSLDDFNSWLSHTFDLPDESYEGMLNRINSDWFADVLKRKYPGVTPKQFLSIIQKAFSPKQAGFQLLTAKQVAQLNKDKIHEVWIGGPVVAIRRDLYLDFLDAFKKRDKGR